MTVEEQYAPVKHTKENCRICEVIDLSQPYDPVTNPNSYDMSDDEGIENV